MSRGLAQIILLVFLLLTPVRSTVAAGNDSNVEQEQLTLLNKAPQGSALNNQRLSPATPGSPGSPAAARQTDDVQQELRDIYGPVTIAEPVNYPLIAGICTALAIILLVIFLLLKNKKEKTAPPVPPWEKALSDLSRARSLMTPEKGLSYMDRASLILRSYIETRFGIRSTRQTTTEFLHGLEAKPHADLKPFKKELRLCLERADMAKFAHQLSNIDSLLQMEEGITGFVNNTRPAVDERGGRT